MTLATPGEAVATQVPLGALHDAGRGPGVWIVSGRAKPTVAWRPVRVSALGEETATVTSGLKSGDRFVAMGAHMLHQGQQVRIAALAAGAAR
ncbi:hypothetical protein U5A82_01350 [Sphingobium sp. CR2-8]|uniref:hypothetical protein n=1 Tax=Sphingobium sp. CR2-8 TaxID=1306534 RepID=UPI002DBB0D92|nr:hypothetical protein [Sphingobium sp. CR2-8]MEC3909162.1 hypothetical protein [Sphingobium sp. CR2-8]